MLEFVRLMGMLAISCWENTLQPSTFAEATVDKSKNQTSSAVVVSPDQQLSVKREINHPPSLKLSWTVHLR
jgi:hypothetical protein